MKSFKELLKETISPNKLSEILRRYPRIKEECSEYLSVLPRGKFLFRGVFGNSFGDYFKRKSPENRSSESAKTFLATQFNKFLEQKGIATKRDAAIYTFRNIDLLEEYYGDTAYYIFPCNGFKYCWSRSSSSFCNDLELHFGRKHFLKMFSLNDDFNFDTHFPEPLRIELEHANLLQKLDEEYKTIKLKYPKYADQKFKLNFPEFFGKVLDSSPTQDDGKRIDGQVRSRPSTGHASTHEA